MTIASGNRRVARSHNPRMPGSKVRTPTSALPARPDPLPGTALARLVAKKAIGEPIVMVTAYDYASAQVAEAAEVDAVLVGDSAAMTVLGYASTVSVSMDEMLMLASAVRRGLKTPLMVGDMPFGSYEMSNEQAVLGAQRFIKEAGCDAVKIERGGTSVERARAIVAAGIPVMGHVGLTPQTVTALGGYRAQGRTADCALNITRDALALQEAGCFALVVEAVPIEVTAALMPHIHVPVIGIGAGAATDGQVLVFHDLLGMHDGHTARFVQRYRNVRQEMIDGVKAFGADVRARRYPEPKHGYHMMPNEVGRLQARLADMLPRKDRAGGNGHSPPLPATPLGFRRSR